MKRIAKVILYKKDEVLLQLRDDKPDIPFPNYWSLFGGLIDEGETPEEALKREVKEEIRYNLKDFKQVHKGIRKEGDIEVEDNVFAAEIDCDISELKLTEGQALNFFPVKDLDKIKVMPKWKELILKFFSGKL